MRIYNSPQCPARGLALLQPRRNVSDAASVYGREAGEVTIPCPGGSEQEDMLVLQDGQQQLVLRVDAACVMCHAGDAANWCDAPPLACVRAFVRPDAMKGDEESHACKQPTLHCR